MHRLRHELLPLDGRGRHGEVLCLRERRMEGRAGVRVYPDGLRQRIHHHGQEEQHHGVLVRGTARRRKGRLRERHKHHVGRQPRYGGHGRRGAALCLRLRRRPPHAAHLYRRGDGRHRDGDVCVYRGGRPRLRYLS